MKNHRFLWLRNRTTDNRKCEKARNIKEKRTIEMFSTASKPPVAHLSSARDNLCEKMPKNPGNSRLNSDKVLFSIARGRERCDRNGHAVFLRPGVDFATTSSETTGISTSSTKLK